MGSAGLKPCATWSTVSLHEHPHSPPWERARPGRRPANRHRAQTTAGRSQERIRIEKLLRRVAAESRTERKAVEGRAVGRRRTRLESIRPALSCGDEDAGHRTRSGHAGCAVATL